MNNQKPGPEHGLTKENFLAALPMALWEDDSIAALAETAAEFLARPVDEIDRLKLYPEVDRLDEHLLDILAYDFKVDWWDPDYSLEEKRKTLKDSWRVHRIMGTKAAVETAISAIYPDAKVQEWFEYGGKPYHFRLSINVTNETVESEKQKRVLQRLNFYKNLRSHVDSVDYFMQAAPVQARAGAGVLGSRMCVGVEIPIPQEVLAPHVRPGVKAGAGIAGQYQRIGREMELYAALE